jgi:hypothetical protein
MSEMKTLTDLGKVENFPTIITYFDKDIRDLSKEELLKCVKQLMTELDFERKRHQATLRINSYG